MRERGIRESKLFFLIVFVLCFNTPVFSQKRIISLGPSLTEELYLLGAEKKIVGCTTYCKCPKQKVGNAIEVNVEKILSLKPDLVLATSLTNQRDIEKLNALGINVVTFKTPRNFSEICEQFLRLARIVKKEQKAKEIIKQANTEIEVIKKRIKGLPRPRVFIQIGARPLFTAPKDLFINDLIELAGGINIASSKTGLYSREKVIEDNPDVIIIVTMGIVGEREKRQWETYKVVEAVKRKRIYFMDSKKVCNATPLNFIEALKEIVKLIHPEIKENG